MRAKTLLIDCRHAMERGYHSADTARNRRLEIYPICPGVLDVAVRSE